MIAVTAGASVLRAASSLVSTAAIAATTARGVLHPRAEIIADSRPRRLLLFRQGIFRGNRQFAFGRCDSRFELKRVFGFAEGLEIFPCFRFGICLVFGGCCLTVEFVLFCGHMVAGFRESRNHAFRFGAGFFFLEFVFFRFGRFLSRIGRFIRRRKDSFLSLARGFFVLRFGNVLGERRGFIFAQFRRCVFLVHDSGFVRFGLLVQKNVLFLCFLGARWRSWFGVFDDLRLVPLPLGKRLAGQWFEPG